MTTELKFYLDNQKKVISSFYEAKESQYLQTVDDSKRYNTGTLQFI